MNHKAMSAILFFQVKIMNLMKALATKDLHYSWKFFQIALA